MERATSDPKPTVDRIEELARRILDADILLPKFQRDFVWDKGQILILLDSIARGYPVGSILLWCSRLKLRSENNIAGLQIKQPKDEYPVNYLLDGQQRLSTICGALFWKGNEPKSKWNIAFDLRTNKFLHLDTIDDPPSHQIRVNKLSDPAEFFKHVYALDSLSAPDRAVLKQRATELFNRFKDYKIATVTLGDMSLQDVAPIFERINSQGTALTIVDLMRAATWSEDFDLVDSIAQIRDELSVKGFGALDRKALLRSISAAAGGGFSSESIDKLRNHSASELKAAVEKTRQAYMRTVDFLQTEIKVGSASILPYANQVVVLAETFRMLPNPTAEQYRAISIWYWRTSLGGYFGGWNTGSMGRDHKAVADFAAGTSAEISFPFADPLSRIWRERQFRSNNALSKLFAITLCQKAPRDLLTGMLIDTEKALSRDNQKEFHHFFPRRYLEEVGAEREKINLLANMVLLTATSNKRISKKRPSEYLKWVKTAAGPELKQWLESNLISDSAYKAALKDDYEAFLSARAETIHAILGAKAGLL